MPILDVIGLSKSLGSRTLLQNVHFTVVRGEKVGLLGDNGSGKSTLGKILAGVTEGDAGKVSRRRGARIGYLPQEPALPAGMSAEEAALSGLTAWQTAHKRYQTLCKQLETAKAKDAAVLLAEQAALTAEIEQLGGWNRHDEARRVLTQLGITALHQDVATMSGGERRRVALARLLIESPDLAILDEPTNHMDADTIEWLEEYLSTRFPGAVVLITHDRFLLNSVVTRTLEIENGQVHSYQGGWEEYLQGKDERRARSEREEANRQNFLRTELEWLRRSPKARTGKQKARIGRAEEALARSPEKQQSHLKMQIESSRLGGNILEARGLTIAVGGRTLARNLDFHLTAGERIGIVGRSGAGKTTLLRTLIGQLEPNSGEVLRGKNTTFAYLDQMRSGMDDTENVFDAVTGGRPSVRLGDTDLASYSYLKRFRFEGEVLKQKVSALSGGERSRLALAKLLLARANVLVLDEPTNDLDVMTLSALEDMILSLKGAALVVSHDRYFLDRVATSVLALDGQGGVDHIQGGYSEYAEIRKAQMTRAEKTDSADAEKPVVGAKVSTSHAKKKLTYAEELELEKLYPQVEAWAEKVAELEQMVADPSLYTERRDEAAALHQSLEAARRALSECEQRWLELEERREG
jgi:ABC transport system ATP-binding/permease protein